MMSLRKITIPVLLTGLALMSGCTLGKMIKMSKDQMLTVNPNPLELHSDSVKFEVSAKLPVKMLKKGFTYTAAPSYKYSDQNMKLEEVVFRAEDFPNSNVQQPMISKTYVFPYNNDYKRGELVFMGIATGPNGKSKNTVEMPYAKGVITTSSLAQASFKGSYVDRGYNQDEELEPTNVAFYFEQGKFVLRKSEIKGSNGKFLDAFIAAKNVTRIVNLTGMHSPEGIESINSKLSEDRPVAIEKYYREQMKKFEYGGSADSIKFVIKPIVRDWTAFNNALKNYDKVSEDQKAEIMNIVNGAGTFEEKEKQLQTLSSYKPVFKDLYPALRTAKTEILTVKKKKTDGEIATMAKGISDGSVAMDSLSDPELSYAAMLTPILEERAEIYKAAIKKDDSWESHNNLGATYIDLAQKVADKSEKAKHADMAITHLDIAKNKKLAAEVMSNLANAHLIKGNYIGSLQASTQATTLAPNATTQANINAVKGMAEVRAALYKNATTSLSNAYTDNVVKFDLGLAYLLDKQYDKAKSAFNDVINADNSNAWAHYGNAVVAARQENPEACFASLKNAASLDNNIKTYALDDLEFMKYFELPGFKTALQ